MQGSEDAGAYRGFGGAEGKTENNLQVEWHLAQWEISNIRYVA